VRPGKVKKAAGTKKQREVMGVFLRIVAAIAFVAAWLIVGMFVADFFLPHTRESTRHGIVGGTTWLAILLFNLVCRRLSNRHP
jgi:hypothetical protein